MTPANFTSTMLTSMIGAGLAGDSTPDFADAVGTGVVGGLIGASFTTIDTGTIASVGTGSGVALTGPIAAVVASSLDAALLTAFGSIGTSTPSINLACASAFVAEIALATLTSSHTLVFLGNGVITPGSIVVPGATISSSIEASGIGSGFLGTSWPLIANVIGTEIANSMLLATGNVVITGAPPPPPAVPIPGVGSGTGVIS